MKTLDILCDPYVPIRIQQVAITRSLIVFDTHFKFSCKITDLNQGSSRNANEGIFQKKKK